MNINYLRMILTNLDERTRALASLQGANAKYRMTQLRMPEPANGQKCKAFKLHPILFYIQKCSA